MRQKVPRNKDFAYSFAAHHHKTQLTLEQGTRAWGDKAINSVKKEAQQMYNKNVYKPVDFNSLTQQEKLAALRSIIFLKEKRCEQIKARLCADGQSQQSIYEKGEAASPTVKTEPVLLTAVQKGKERWDICVVDIPGAFLNVYLKEVVHMHLEGVLTDALSAVDPDVYGKAAFKNKNSITLIYVQLIQALFTYRQSNCVPSCGSKVAAGEPKSTF